MNRNEFIVLIAIILFASFALGWIVSWLFNRFIRSTRDDMTELDRMARSLQEAEEQRDRAIEYLEARETELINQQRQTEAELDATMEGLRDARREAEELRAYIERSSQGD